MEAGHTFGQLTTPGPGSFYMSLDKWECQRRALSLFQIQIGGVTGVCRWDDVCGFLGFFHSVLGVDTPSRGDIEFFFPHLDALPVERTLAASQRTLV